MAFTCLVYAGFLYIVSFRKLTVAPKGPIKYKSVDMIEMSFISKKTASDVWILIVKIKHLTTHKIYKSFFTDHLVEDLL